MVFFVALVLRTLFLVEVTSFKLLMIFCIDVGQRLSGPSSQGYWNSMTALGWLSGITCGGSVIRGSGRHDSRIIDGGAYLVAINRLGIFLMPNSMVYFRELSVDLCQKSSRYNHTISP